MRNRLALLVLLVVVSLLTGCASVPMASIEHDTQAKTFAVESDKANIYLFRNEFVGPAVKMDVVLDGKPVGQTVAKSYMKFELKPGQHTLISKAEKDDVLYVNVEAGKNYFVWQEVKFGIPYARSLLHLTDEQTGKAGVLECKLIEGPP
jgi:uncharacterized protein YceK